ncbi:MAG: hypothetical protein ACREC0_13720 [Methylocella sp.]
MANSAAQFDTLGRAPVLIKNAAGTLFGYEVGSADGSPAMVLLYDKATAPVYGTDTPLVRVLLPPFGQSARTSATGVGFTKGLYLLVVTMHGTQQRNISGHVEFL